jgi:hypothetical protein
MILDEAAKVRLFMGVGYLKKVAQRTLRTTMNTIPIAIGMPFVFRVVFFVLHVKISK